MGKDKAIEYTAEEVRKRFLAKCAMEGGVDALGKAAFKDLVKAMKISKKLDPTEADLDAAFAVADEDKSGNVDEFEFSRLFQLVQAGKVKGLGKVKATERAEFRAAVKGTGEAFRAGDTVAWTKADDDLPEGTVGRVLCVHPDGDVEVLFATARGEELFTFAAASLILAAEAPGEAAAAAVAAGEADSEATRLRARFYARLAAQEAGSEWRGGEEEALNKAEFKALVKEIMFDRDAEPPTDADLEAAFTVADENRSGNVDVFEFIRLFQLIKTGKVNGLGRQGKAVQGKFSAAFKGAAAFGPGDAVVWKSSDEDLPAGTVGRVLCLHDDGDVEVLFPAAGAAGEASEGVFTFAADRLEKDKASPSLEVGDWVVWLGDQSRAGQVSRMGLSLDEEAADDQKAKRRPSGAASALAATAKKAGAAAKTAKGKGSAAFAAEPEGVEVTYTTPSAKPGSMPVSTTVLLPRSELKRGDSPEVADKVKAKAKAKAAVQAQSDVKEWRAQESQIQQEQQQQQQQQVPQQVSQQQQVPQSAGCGLYPMSPGGVATPTGTQSGSFMGVQSPTGVGGVVSPADPPLVQGTQQSPAGVMDIPTGMQPGMMSPTGMGMGVMVTQSTGTDIPTGNVSPTGMLGGGFGGVALDGAMGQNPLMSGQEGITTTVGGGAIASAPVGGGAGPKPPCSACSAPWQEVAGLFGDGKHSRCCRECFKAFCSACKFSHMVKSPKAGASGGDSVHLTASDGHGGMPKMPEMPEGVPKGMPSMPTSSLTMPTDMPDIKAKDLTAAGDFSAGAYAVNQQARASAWLCRPCAQQAGVALHSPCHNCGAPWVEKASFLGLGSEHSRACMTCAKAFCARCKNEHMVKEGNTEALAKKLGRFAFKAPPKQGDFADAAAGAARAAAGGSREFRQRDCLDCHTKKSAALAATAAALAATSSTGVGRSAAQLTLVQSGRELAPTPEATPAPQPNPEVRASRQMSF